MYFKCFDRFVGIEAKIGREKLLLPSRGRVSGGRGKGFHGVSSPLFSDHRLNAQLYLPRALSPT